MASSSHMMWGVEKTRVGTGQWTVDSLTVGVADCASHRSRPAVVSQGHRRPLLSTADLTAETLTTAMESAWTTWQSTSSTIHTPRRCSTSPLCTSSHPHASTPTRSSVAASRPVLSKMDSSRVWVVLVVLSSLLFLSLVHPSLGRRSRHHLEPRASVCSGKSHGTAGQFDIYVLAQSSSPQYCESSSTFSKYPGCVNPTAWQKTNLTMHGLWPQYSTAKGGYGTHHITHIDPPLQPFDPHRQPSHRPLSDYPECCSSKYGTTLTQSAVTPLLPQLEKYWPNEEDPTGKTLANTLWAHEWMEVGPLTLPIHSPLLKPPPNRPALTHLPSLCVLSARHLQWLSPGSLPPDRHPSGPHSSHSLHHHEQHRWHRHPRPAGGRLQQRLSMWHWGLPCLPGMRLLQPALTGRSLLQPSARAHSMPHARHIRL